jgi:broad specificity phosphatase PhoE
MTSSRRLVLVRHSTPEIRRELPAREWRLSPDGVARARALSRRLSPPAADTIFTSLEPKAVETARALAGEWGLAVNQVPGLHEHERPEARMLTRDAFEQKIRELFARPNDLIFGVETADQARRRFTMAVMRLVVLQQGDVMVVTHGTVMALFVAEAAGMDPFALWRRQEMPCAVTLTLPDLRVERTTTLNG